MALNTFSLAGRRAVVTGAAGNLGRAVVAVLREQGADVVALDVSDAVLSAVLGSVLPAPSRVAINLLDEAAAAPVLAGMGRVDILCNLVGGFAMGPAVAETPPALWSRMFDLNLGTALCAIRHLAPGMAGRGVGRIVNVGALSAASGVAGMAAYTAAKSAVQRMTEALSAELKAQGVNVNCVLPSIIDTPENRAAMPDANPSDWVAPHDLAQVIAFLVSDAARAVHGAGIPVTGGR